MFTIAKIAVSGVIYSIDRPYSYLIPEHLEEHCEAGCRVVVPFGNGNKTSEGIILSIETADRIERRLKKISYLLDDSPIITNELIKLGYWMRERYFCTFYDAVRTMLPSGLNYSIKDSFKLKKGIDKETAYSYAGKSVLKCKVLDVLFANEKSIYREVLCQAVESPGINRVLMEMVNDEILEVTTHADKKVADKIEKIAELNVNEAELGEILEKLGKRAPVQRDVMELLGTIGCASTKDIAYFTGCTAATLNTLEKKGYITFTSRESFRIPLVADAGEKREYTLNGDQQAVYDGLLKLANKGEACASLLYGVTGSGKTQVYIKLIDEMLRRGKGIIMMVPEIALTPQFVRIFKSQFGDDIAVLHSSLKSTERYDEWKRVRKGLAKVVVGTRSAVFAPVVDLGLIIIDEEHETSYKSENSPKYHARDIAKYRCVQNNAVLLMGSATPSVESFYYAREGRYHLFRLDKRYNNQALPEVIIADLKEELKHGNGSSISDVLAEEIEKNIKNGEQTILFLNRRGMNKMLSCVECGHVPTCPNCSVHLTYHASNHRLMCHYCGHSEPVKDQCGECGGSYEFVGYGTQMVEDDLRRRFPDVEILRMDADTISAKNTHEVILKKFEKGKVPILIGTQMVAKGLDFENVTLVGVISADSSLYVSSYKAGERTFSLITQVVGRSGRGDKLGRAVIQTLTPDNDVILNASAQDYEGFYAGEIEMRRMLNRPPFCDEVQVLVTGEEEANVVRTATRFAESIRAAVSGTVYGPAPAPILKINNRFRYLVTISQDNNKQLRDAIGRIIASVQKDKNNTVSISVDINPID